MNRSPEGRLSVVAGAPDVTSAVAQAFVIPFVDRWPTHIIEQLAQVFLERMRLQIDLMSLGFDELDAAGQIRIVRSDQLIKLMGPGLLMQLVAQVAGHCMRLAIKQLIGAGVGLDVPDAEQAVMRRAT
ncbi:hypothetical protein RA263_10770 [Pseudomonas syringae pv. tagetis]|uniref:Uncharacterized protein n=1 Tax=Pseudomonas syringae pv. tagetis TaxID=129140 RepID=A0ABW7NKQ0_9PSED|nr:hypothetical protein [Pseudomonas syringae group genomosp. 7]UNB60853.1 hypothetical protein MME54_14245 [Pseudomonas syringae pv. helianthi]UNB71051.1 hypothetical protein MME58_12840 [Pseudomonas syringae pv. tagetis]